MTLTEQELRRYLKKAVGDARSAVARAEELEARAREPIAIVGIACRFAGGVTSTFFPPIVTWPEVWSSRPAMMRSSVDFPQPDGPTKTTNSPSATSRSTPRMTSVDPKRLVMF